jgi:cyclopropane fatty-acyl-phospholipid synthase-like methyltransferase
MKQHAPATERNRAAIREVLERELPATGTVLEIASGTGQHAVHFAAAFPALVWQPSDPDATARASIAAYRAEAGLPNLAAPLALDVTAPWPLEAVDAIVCINMVHISPWESTLALFAGAGQRLAEGALLYLYGPYRFDGTTAAANEQFDQSLRSRDPRWGVRDVRELGAAASENGLVLRGAVAMPANNHSLLFRRA